MSIVAESNIASASPAAVSGRGATRLTGQPAHRLELRVQTGDEYTLVQVWGELYTSRLSELTRLLDGLVRAGSTRILLDISRLYDLDGDAISELGRWRTALHSSGGWLWLAAPRPWVRRLLEHMCLRGTFTVFPNLAEAFAEIDRTLASTSAASMRAASSAPVCAAPVCTAPADEPQLAVSRHRV